jgi:molybdopterin-containing oxidoreductase family iron-sulfur binding subunit
MSDNKPFDPVGRVAKTVEVALAKPVERRGFLKGLVATSVAAFAASETFGVEDKKAASGGVGGLSFDSFFQKHYKELTPEEKVKVMERLKAEIKEDYKVDVTMDDPPPIAGVKFGYFLNLLKCNGNRKCVDACRKENNQDESISYIKVLEMDRSTFDVEKSDKFYSGTVPKAGKFYMPVQCQQCDNAPCIKSCPIGATWQEKDGIVVIDYNWCIGCRYCMVACPYEARSFNFQKPRVKEVNPNQSYLSNRVRPNGVVEKCTFCLHRTRKGLNPACMEACPTGARKFGNLADPDSEVSRIFREKKLFILKEELNTLPRFFYYFDE